MKKYLLAIALTVAIPAMAHAQAVTAAPKAPCCEKMKDMACCKDGKMECCKDMAKMDHSGHGMKAGADPHAGHDMSKMDHGSHGAKAVTEPHAGHDTSKPMAKSPSAIATPSN